MQFNQTRQSSIMRKIFILPVMIMILVGFMNLAVKANSTDSALIDSMKEQFNQAIVDGNADKAKEIWASIDERFDDKYDKLTAKSLILGGGTMARVEVLNKLYATQPVKFERVALFLSSINMNFMSEEDGSETAILSGKIRNDQGKGVANAKVVFAGVQTTTNDQGEYTLNGLPEGTYDLLAFAAGYQLTGDNARTVLARNNVKLGLRMHASNYRLPEIAPDEARAKMDDAMTQIGNAITPATPTGTETIEGTVVDANTGAPIEHARFMIAPVKADASLARVAETDSNGHFTLTGVHTGVSKIVITPDTTRYHLPFGQTVNMSGGGKVHRATWKLKPVE